MSSERIKHLQLAIHRALPVAMLLAVTGCRGWVKPELDQNHVKEVGALFKERYSDEALDLVKLTKADPHAAVPGPKGELASDEAVRLALEHNLSLITQAESLPIAQANLVQAGLLPNPTVGQTSAFYFPLSGQGGYTAFDMFLSTTINEFWTTPRKVAIAKAERFQAGIDVSTAAFNLAQQTRQQYEQLAYLSRDGALQLRIAQTYKQAMEEARVMLKSGLVTKSDFNRALIAYEDNMRQAHHYQTQYEGAATQMNWLMGVQGPVEWKLPASIQDSPKVLPALPNEKRLEELAVKYRLDLMRADFDREIAKVGVDLAKMGFIPQVTLGFDAARDSSKNWTGGPLFSTSVPIFDPAIVAYWTARYQQIQTESTCITLQGQCRQDVRNALNALQVATEDVTFSRDVTIPQEEENIKQAELSYKLGNSQFDDYLNSIREYVGVLQGYEDQIQAYNQAVIGLETAVGLSFKRIAEMSAGSVNSPTTGPDIPGLKNLPAAAPAEHHPFSLEPSTQPSTQPDFDFWRDSQEMPR
jgi:cobalt-zinc-cadmium efflux system outer membrane protein